MSKNLKKSMTARLPILAVWLVILNFAGSGSAWATTISMSYSGRLTDSNGAPLDGTVAMEARFWTLGTDGTQLGRTLDFPAVTLSNGVFSVNLEIADTDAAVIFGSSDDPVFVEITASGRVYPRQKFSYVPYALRVPVDKRTIKFDGAGKLTLAVGALSGDNQFLTKDAAGNLTWGSPQVTKLQNQTVSAAAPSIGQVLKYDGSQWVASSLTTNSNSFVGILPVTSGGTGTTTLNSNSVLLGNGTDPVQAVAPGVSGSVLTSDGITWTSATLPATTWAAPGAIGATTPSSGSFTTIVTSSNVGIGSTAPSAELDVNGRIKIQGGSPGAGKVLTSDADGLASWIWPAFGSVTSVATGTGLSGGPITGTGTISLADTNVTPGSYTRATITVDQQGRLTAASNGPSITDADIDVAANIAQSKISGLSSSLIAKEDAISQGANFQYWRGDKTWRTLDTEAVAEGTNQYFTPARAISSLSSADPITYSTVTGTIGIIQASRSGDGYLSSTDWTTFNNKQNALGFNPVNKAGDTLTGALNGGGFDLTNSGNIQMSTAKTLTLSNNISDPAGLSAADAGRTWYNSTSNQIKYWDGSATQSLGIIGGSLNRLNGQTGSTQAFGLPGTSGTAPAWSSSSDIHTLHIPMASAASVTAGLISNADYTTFSEKVSNVAAGGGIAITTASGTATVALTNVGTAGTYTKVTTDINGRVTNASSLLPTDIPPLSTTAITTGVFGVANGGTGVSTLAANNVLLGNGTSALQTVAPSTSGNVLTSNGTTWTSAAIPATNWAVPGAIGATTPNFGSFTTLTTSGNVGIGTTSPAASLDVNGQIKIQGGTPGAGKVLTSDANGLATWSIAAVGSITGVTAGAGLTGGGSSDTVTLSADVGTTANKLVQLDATAKLPAVDGSALTNLNPYNLSSAVSVANGGTGFTSGTSGGIPYFNATSTMASSAELTSNGVVLGGGAGAAPTATAAGAVNSVLRVPSGGGAPSFGAIDISQSSAVTGALNLGNGGTGSSLLLTGGTGQYLKQTASGATVSVGTIAAADLPTMVGDSGAGGTKGAVPAPASGDAAAGKYLKADGTWGVPASTTNWAAPGALGTTTPSSAAFTTLTTSGNVGIGTTNPVARLHLTGGDDSFGTASATVALGQGATGILPHFIHTRHNTGPSFNSIDFYTSDGTVAGAYPTNAVHALTLTNGFVGIGTTLPAAELSFNGTAARTLQMDRHTTANTAGNNLTIQAGGATSGATDKAGGTLYLASGIATGNASSAIEFQTATASGVASQTTDRAVTTKMIVTGSGNVGIGTTSPGNLLNVYGTSNGEVGAKVSNVNTGTSAYTILRVANDTANNMSLFLNSSTRTNDGGTNTGTLRNDAGALQLQSSGANGISIAATSGNVGVGTTSPNAKFQVNGQAASVLASISSLTVDFNNGNIQTNGVAAGTLVLNNMIDGASYTLVLTNATGGNYVLSGSGVSSWKCSPTCAGNTVTLTAGTHTVVSLMKIGATGYVSWINNL